LPGKTAKRWGPWGQEHVVIEKSNLNDINVDEVFETVRRHCDKEKKANFYWNQ